MIFLFRDLATGTAIVVAMVRNRARTGRNTEDIFLGIGIRLRLVFSTLVSCWRHGARRRLNFLPGTAYDAALLIWLISLWKYDLDPAPAGAQIEKPGLRQMIGMYSAEEAQA